MELLTHLVSNAFKVFFQKCICNSVIYEAGEDFGFVKRAFLKNFAKHEALRKVIRRVSDKVFDSKALSDSVDRFHSQYIHVRFRNGAKFGIFLLAVTKTAPLVTFLMYSEIRRNLSLTMKTDRDRLALLVPTPELTKLNDFGSKNRKI